jgi:hypothetical protein
LRLFCEGKPAYLDVIAKKWSNWKVYLTKEHLNLVEVLID